MEQTLILLFTTAILFGAPGITENLPFQSKKEGNTMLYACAQNSSGSPFFQNAKLDTNDKITRTETTVKEIRGKVDGDRIQCEFNVTNLNASSTSSTQDTTFDLRLGSGDVDGETLVNFTTSLTFKALNLSDPTSNAVTTTGASCALLSHAVRLLLSMLTLSILKTA